MAHHGHYRNRASAVLLGLSVIRAAHTGGPRPGLTLIADKATTLCRVAAPCRACPGGAGTLCRPDDTSGVSTATDTIHAGSYVDRGQPIRPIDRGRVALPGSPGVTSGVGHHDQRKQDDMQ